MATVAVALSGGATSDKTSDKEPQWVYGNPWFSWFPTYIRRGASVIWSGGVTGFGTLFHAVVQINRPAEIDIPSWGYTIDKGGYCEPCKVIDVGWRYMDGQWWRTWSTWNPYRNSIYCVCLPFTTFTIEVSGQATPRACGQFTGRSQGGVSGYFYAVSATLDVYC
jgi:hypothetical protein